MPASSDPAPPRLPDVSWGGLEAFYQVVSAGGFRRAAKQFDTSASALHQRVTRLEESLEYLVLNRRNPRQIVPSEAGDALFHFIAPFFEGLGEVLERAAGRGQSTLRIASTQAILLNRLASALARFQSRAADVEVRISERPWLEIVELVRRGRVDLGFAPAPLTGHDLMYDGIFDSELQLICPTGHRLLEGPLPTLERIAAEPLVLLPPESATGTIVWARFDAARVPLRPFCVTSNVGTIQHFVAEGLGVAIVSGVAVPDRERRFGVRPVGELFGALSQGVIWRRHWQIRPAVRAFLALLPPGERLAAVLEPRRDTP